MFWRQKSFDVLPALSVRGQPLRASLRTVTAAWMFGVVWMSCICGSQMTLFGELLGFNNKDFGRLAAIPFAATFAQLIAAMIVERTGLRKHIFIFHASIHRMLWLVIAAVPMVLRPGRAAIAAFLAVYAVSALLAQMSMPPWMNWMGDLIPRRIRGRYLANRRLWTLPIQIIIVMASGLVLDAATRKDPTGAAIAPVTAGTQPYLLLAISAIFAVGAIFGIIDVLLFLRMREIVSPALLNRPSGRKLKPLRAVLEGLAQPVRLVADAVRDRIFRNYALYGATIAFSMTVGGQFFWRNALNNIGYSKFGANVVFLGCGALSAFLVVRPLGKLLDRWGRRPVLILCTAGVVLGPLGWFLIPPRPSPPAPAQTAEAVAAGAEALTLNGLSLAAAEGPAGRLLKPPRPRAGALAYAIGAGACMLGSIMWSGINLAQTSVVLGFAQTSGRSKYMAAAAVFAALGGFLGGITGGHIAHGFEYLQHRPISVGPFLWNNYHLTFAASSLARAAAVLWLIGMPDPGAKPFREVVRIVRFNAYNNVMTRLFWPMRAWGLRLLQRQRARKAARKRPQA